MRGNTTVTAYGATQMTMEFDWTIFLAELETKEDDLLEMHLRNCPFHINEQADEKGFTLIHHAVLKCIPGKIETLINLAKSI